MGEKKVRSRKGKVANDLKTDRRSRGLEVVRWLTVRPQGSWQACLHATCRKQRVIVVWHSTTTGNGLWHRKEIQYRAFIKLQPAWELSVLKYSNYLACSGDMTVTVFLLSSVRFDTLDGYMKNDEDVFKQANIYFLQKNKKDNKCIKTDKSRDMWIIFQKLNFLSL